VYACGSRQPLFARPERVSAIQALLHTLTQLADQAAAGCPELHGEGMAVWPPAAERCAVGGADPRTFAFSKGVSLAWLAAVLAQITAMVAVEL
jgi:hypothetical protein